jgi:hypothetical protein
LKKYYLLLSLFLFNLFNINSIYYLIICRNNVKDDVDVNPQCITIGPTWGITPSNIDLQNDSNYYYIISGLKNIEWIDVVVLHLLVFMQFEWMNKVLQLI